MDGPSMPAHNAKDLTGQRFSQLTALKRGPTTDGKSTWICRCDCGGEKTVLYWSLKAGYTRSCGCLQRENWVRPNRRTHGQTKTPLFRLWSAMKGRCLNPTAGPFKNYGARGVTVCDRWRDSFEAFSEDMGPRPSPDHSIDRIDVDGPYSPENCRWATRSEQQANKRNSRLIEAFGKKQNAYAWARETGLKPRMIYMRVVKFGWDPEKALTTPPHG